MPDMQRSCEVSEPAEPTVQAWDHLYAAAPPELRRWLDSGKPVAAICHAPSTGH